MKPLSSAIIVLAAGRSTRMGASNKLLLDWEDGAPIVRCVVANAIAGDCGPVFVVVGHQAEAVAAALDGCDCQLVENPRYPDGLVTSLQAGFGAALAAGADGAFVLLGDMPLVGPDIIATVQDVAAAHPQQIVEPRAGDKPAHPVWLPARLSDAIGGLEGDMGARILGKSDELPVVTVQVGEAATADIDTPEAYCAATGRPTGAH